MKRKLYVFSGLGADERVFRNLEFPGFSAVFIKWILPKERETIEAYATRILAQITDEQPILVGLSFGGIMAIEVAKQIGAERVLLIASAKNRKEIPFYYRLAENTGLHKMLPASLLKSSNFITNWFFGLKSNSDIQLLKQILIDTNPIFLKWAIDKIVCWKNETIVKRVFHIHGASDRILPIKFVDCDIEIRGGGHLMTLNKSKQLNEILKQQLSLLI